MYCRWWTPGSIILLKDRAKNGSDHSLLEILGANLGQREILPNLANSMAHNFPPFFSIKRLFIQHWPSKPSPHASEGQGVINNINSYRLQVSMTKKKRLPPTLLVSIHTYRQYCPSHVWLALQVVKLVVICLQRTLGTVFDVCDTRNWMDRSGSSGKGLDFFHVQTEGTEGKDDFFTMEICSAPGYSGCFKPDAIRTRCQGRSVWKPSLLRDCDLGEQPVESCWLEDFSEQKSLVFFWHLDDLEMCVLTCSFEKDGCTTKSISCCIFLLGDLHWPLAIWVCGWKLQMMEAPSSESPFCVSFSGETMLPSGKQT